MVRSTRRSSIGRGRSTGWSMPTTASQSEATSSPTGGSGVKIELRSGGTVMELSSRGKIARQEWFVEQNGWQRALEAVGLSE